MARESYVSIILDPRAEQAAQFLLQHPLPVDPVGARRVVAAFCAHMGIADTLWEAYRSRAVHWCQDHGVPVPISWERKGNRTPIIFAKAEQRPSIPTYVY